MYDESWCPQIARLPCKNGNYRYETDSNLAHCSTDETELKEFLVNKNLSQICYTDEDESKGIIVNKFSTEEDK